MNIRIGQGFDVHAFGAGDHVWLGGVRIAPAQPCWRWDDGATAPKLIPPHPL